MSERDSVVTLVDKEPVREAAEHTVVEIWKKCLKVSVGISSFSYSEVDLFSRSQKIGGQ